MLAEKAKNNLDTANFSLVINAKYLRQKGTRTRVALKVFVADEQEVEEHKQVQLLVAAGERVGAGNS